MKIRWEVFFLAVLSTGSSLAQTGAAADAATLQSLLNEVRQLRLAIERTGALWPQMQIMLQRVQLQQQYVETLSRQLEQLRDQIARSANESAQLNSRVKESEIRAGQEQDARRRQQAEDEIKRLKAVIEQIAMRDRQQQDRESQLAGALQNEQAKLNDLNARLDAVERLLQAPPPR